MKKLIMLNLLMSLSTALASDVSLQVPQKLIKTDAQLQKIENQRAPILKQIQKIQQQLQKIHANAQREFASKMAKIQSQLKKASAIMKPALNAQFGELTAQYTAKYAIKINAITVQLKTLEKELLPLGQARMKRILEIQNKHAPKPTPMKKIK